LNSRYDALHLVQSFEANIELGLNWGTWELKPCWWPGPVVEQWFWHD